MLIALLADIHANREALEACLSHAGRRPIGRYVFLGDLVGYGADPGFVVDTVRAFAGRGAVVLRGNHDSAALGVCERMSGRAAAAITWTRQQLDAAQLDFLSGLPLSAEEDDRLYVHASAAEPERWDYITDARRAMRSLQASRAAVTFCGHTHVPAVFRFNRTGQVDNQIPIAGREMLLTQDHRWLAVIGSVGEPRDGVLSTCYALYDDTRRALTYERVPYDVETARRKVRAAGLPTYMT